MVGQSRSWVYFMLVLGLSCAHKPPPTFQESVESDIASFQTRVREVVKDPDRAEKLIGLASDYRQLVLDQGAAVKVYKASLQTLNANYAATRAEFEALFQQRTPERAAFASKVIDLRGKIAAVCTDSEWGSLKGARMELLDNFLEVE